MHGIPTGASGFSPDNQPIYSDVINPYGSSSETSYFYDVDGSADGSETINRDNLGHTTSDTRLDNSGNPQTQSLYSYSPTGDLTGRTQEFFTYNAADTLANAVTYSYDGNGRELGFDSFAGIVETSYGVDQYNSDGTKTVTIYNLNADGSSNGTSVANYDSAGRLQGSVAYDAAGDTINTTTVDYNSDGSSTITSTSYNADGSTSGTIVTNFDGRMVTQISVSYGTGQTELQTSNYNENDGSTTVTDTVSNVDGSLASKTVTVYDSQGRKTSYTQYDANSQILVTEAWSYNSDGSYSIVITYPGQSVITEYFDATSKLTKSVSQDSYGNVFTYLYTNGHHSERN